MMLVECSNDSVGERSGGNDRASVICGSPLCLTHGNRHQSPYGLIRGNRSFPVRGAVSILCSHRRFGWRPNESYSRYNNLLQPHLSLVNWHIIKSVIIQWTPDRINLCHFPNHQSPDHSPREISAVNVCNIFTIWIFWLYAQVNCLLQVHLLFVIDK